MAGKRLLDAALFFKATRAVARQHVNVRAQQLDVWSKTSTVAKAVKDQTDRVTLTVRAASALAQRLAESPPSQYTAETKATERAQRVPRQESVDQKTGDATAREGLDQDHHYRRDEENTTFESTKEQELVVQQEKPAPYSPSGARSTSFSHSTISNPQRPQTETIPNQEALPEYEALPDGINTDVFHSPRVAELLGKEKSGRPRGDFSLSHAGKSAVDQGGLHKGKDQDTFNERGSGSIHPTASTSSQDGDGQTKFPPESSPEEMHSLAADLAKDVEPAPAPAPAPAPDQSQAPTRFNETLNRHYEMHESRVPSSRFGRLWQYGGLATSMAFGAVGETFRRATGSGSSGSLMLSASNMERLVARLSRMRGAALKLGQMMSFQDSNMLPAPIAEVLQRVQDNADYMPASQRDKVLSSNLGDDWRSLFSSFNDVPIAAASIGQVHRAILASDSREVAVKIQYPGVATSISSDLSNLSILLTASRLLPKGLFLDKTIANARTELAWECDYLREAACQSRFRTLISDESNIFTVPAVIPSACGPQVLTAEFMHGVGVTKSSLNLSQDERDWIGTQILRLCLRELTEFKFMQTDPNWTNFLFNRSTKRLELLDFGAARDFPDKFVDPYVRILIAAARDDRATIRDLSVQLGYLTGHESKAMSDAHVTSVLTLAEPFKESADEKAAYDFRGQTITDRVRALIPIMVRERLAPPPEETYSLHRKLSGAFLLLAKLGARVKCRGMFVDAVRGWEKRHAGKA